MILPSISILAVLTLMAVAPSAAMTVTESALGVALPHVTPVSPEAQAGSSAGLDGLTGAAPLTVSSPKAPILAAPDPAGSNCMIGSWGGEDCWWWAGETFGGATHTTTSLTTDITVPTQAADPGSYFYDLISAWDNAFSYDQFGFADSYGTWELIYSTTGSCASSYATVDAGTLAQGTQYQFAMSISSGVVTFTETDVGSGAHQAFSVTTGGTYFYGTTPTSQPVGCNDITGFTDYEEAHTGQWVTPYLVPYPAYNVAFTNTEISGTLTSTSTWIPLKAGYAPAGGAVSITIPAAGDVTLTNPGGTGGTLVGFAQSNTYPSLSVTFTADLEAQGSLTALTTGPYDVGAVATTFTLSCATSTQTQIPSASEVQVSQTCTFPAPGTYTFRFTESDQNGWSTSVYPTISVGAVTATLTATKTLGETYQFTATIVGGTGSYTYVLYFGDGTSTTTLPATHAYPTSTCTPPPKGVCPPPPPGGVTFTYVVTLDVTDSAGHTGSAQVTISYKVM